MPTIIGPNGQKRPSDPIASALMVGKIATGEIEEEYADKGKRAAGRKGGKARAAKLSPERRSEIARMGGMAAAKNGA